MGDDATPSIILGRPFLEIGRALIEVQKGELTVRVHDEQMVINVFKAVQYPREEDAEKCMRIDFINMQVKKVQEEDTMLKLQEKYEERYDVLSKTNPKSILQKTKNAPLKDKPTVKQKPLHTTLPNAFLGTVKNLPVIISYLLNAMQHEIRKLWDPVNTRKQGLGVVSGESPRLGPLTPRRWCWRLGVVCHDAAPLSCCLVTPRRCTGRLGVGAEVLGWARA
ncbi:hypothetical protein PIB30_061464 [Stylosanthes scabra]|uniref:Reverse transcriptase domain-containing protein n=1 Tax=Stylosanthes scabra TaxID=79078 RepID=A0ABU6ULR2_9FABA|nr:hypothetical protein [Stylosanthes scabra]